MKIKTITVLLFVGFTIISICQPVKATDFDALLKAVDRIESNLKQIIQREEANRKREIAELRKSIMQMEIAAKSDQVGMTENQMVDLLNELTVIRAEIAQWQNQSHPIKQLASMDPDILSMVSSSDDQQASGFDPSSGTSPLDARSNLEEKGVTFELVYTGELMSNVSGGMSQKSEYLENGDVVLSMDAEKLMGWQGASFSLYALGNRGGSPSGNVGDMQGVSNIEADDTWKLYEAWYQQEFLGGKLSFLTGLFDLNSEFDVIENAGLFLNSSFGIGPDFSQSGENGPSIFPVTSMAFRTRAQVSDAFYVQNAVFDGVPGNPENPNGTHIKFHKTDGVLVATEIGFVTGSDANSDAPYSKFALGSWFYTGKYDDMIDVDGFGNPVQRSGNRGLYLLGERTVFREEDPSQGLALFARLGFADNKVNQIGSYLGGGLNYTGLIPGRDEDQIGFAVASAFNSSKYKQLQQNAGLGVEAAEVTLELSYNSQVLSQVSVHPDIQYVINPNGDPGLKNGLVFSTRFELAF